MLEVIIVIIILVQSVRAVLTGKREGEIVVVVS